MCKTRLGMLCTPMDCISHTMQFFLQLGFNVWVLIFFPVSFGFVGFLFSGFYLVFFPKKKKVFTSQKTPRSSCDVELQLKIKKSYGRFATSGSCVKSSWSHWNKGKDKAIFFGNDMATRDTATKSKACSKAAQCKPSQGTFQGEEAESTAQALQSCGSR